MQKLKPEQILNMDETENEALKKMKTTGMETNEAGNIFQGMEQPQSVTTQCVTCIKVVRDQSTLMLITA